MFSAMGSFARTGYVEMVKLKWDLVNKKSIWVHYEGCQPLSLPPLSLHIMVWQGLEERASDKQWTPGDVNSPFLQSTFTSATKFWKPNPAKHLHQSHGNLYLFIFPLGCLCFIHLIFTMWLWFFLPSPPYLFTLNFIFSHGKELLLVQASMNRCQRWLPVLTEGSILTLSS